MISLYRIKRFLGKLFRGENILTISQPAVVWEKQFKKGNWDFMLEESKRASAKYIASILSQMPKPLSLLDVGCGNGSLALELRTFPDIQYTGIDFSESALARATRENPKATFIQADASNPPQDCIYNALVFSEVLYYLNTDTVLPKYKKILAPDGRVIISMYVSWRNYLIWILLRRQLNMQSVKKIYAKDGSQAWHVAMCTFKP
jgi:trans-aconitate methyltransferase